MQREVITVSKLKLECGSCANVLIQVEDTELLAANVGIIDPDQLQTFLKGKIKEWVPVKDNLGCVYYQYTLTYDDAQLTDPDTPLGECDIIKVCCADCLVDYIDERFIDQSTVSGLVNNGDNSFTHDDGLGNLATIQFGHTLTEPVDGTVRLTRPNGGFDDVDVSVSADLPITGSGTAADPLGLLLSADANNSAVLGTDSGVYVPDPPAETVTTLVDNADSSFTYTSEDATVTNFDAAHTLVNGLAGEVQLNRPDGSFDLVDLVSAVTLPVQGDGSPGNPLDVLISTDVGNAVTLGTDSGLFAPSTSIVDTTLPIRGDGSAGDPVDLLISTDADNVLVLGTDSGLYVPDQADDPSSIIITRTPGESDNNGSGTQFNLRTATLSASGTSTSRYLIQVPADWDTAQDPTVRARLSNASAADGNLRFEWGLRYFAIGEILDSVDDETIGFTLVNANAADQLYETAVQSLTAALIAPGDFMAVSFRRQGGDAADTQTGSAFLYQIAVEFPRLGFGVTT